ncbi:unnamed protein product [Linum tenue]|uniref:ZF-HD dimerization-type domain-containing protein n=1 Tax=Linum tenue TaxID=586396 RepID=A0AAV0KBT5_9ROSI|nr:unnamed protein product [Linum tenue]
MATRSKYRECPKNQAVGIGGHVVDGCREFLPSGPDGRIDALKCAACTCHRNFHRLENDDDSAAAPRLFFHHHYAALLAPTPPQLPQHPSPPKEGRRVVIDDRDGSFVELAIRVLFLC